MTLTDESTLTRVISRDGTEIAYWTTGDGPPLVLVHGTTADHTRWRPLLPYLEPHATVHAMDRRRRGGSGDRPDYELAREYEDVAAVVDAVAEEWADRTWRIGRTAADDLAEVERLRRDFSTATDGLQRDLRRIATMLGFELPEQSAPRTPLDELLLLFVRPTPLPLRAARTDLDQLRGQIARCAQLRHQTRRIWLEDLTPDPAMRGYRLADIPVDVVRALQQKVAVEAKYAAEASLIDGSLALLRSYIQSSTG
jgi:hypothetical protein